MREGVSASKRDAPYAPCQPHDHKSPQQLFAEADPDLRHVMKEVAKQIWSLISELDQRVSLVWPRFLQMGHVTFLVERTALAFSLVFFSVLCRQS